MKTCSRVSDRSIDRSCQTVMRTLSLLTSLSTLAAVLLLQLPACAGQDSLNTTEYMNDRETLVEKVGSFALQNYLDQDALADTCNNSSNCSRRVCGPLLRDLDPDALTCLSASIGDCQSPNNSICRDEGLFSMKEAYVRYPPEADTEDPTCDMKATICAQRQLDWQVFNTSAVQTNITIPYFELQAWVYFGASNGIDRIYPGRELNETACQMYEIRERPWYVGATAVFKNVVVMLDFGPTMGNPLTVTDSDHTVFDASRNITCKLIRTLSDGDSISVFTFGSNSSFPTSIVGSEILVNITPSWEDPALDPLQNILKNGLQSPPNGGVNGNLSAALYTALDQFMESSQQMKVVIIITDGNMDLELQPDLVDSLANVTVFIYRLLVNGGVQNDAISTSLSNIACSLNGWFEESIYEMQNPLGMVQSFYSYFAKLRFDQTGGRPYWVPAYQGFSGIGQLITVAYPVFNGSFLVGVAGVDILVADISMALQNSLDTTASNLSSISVTNPNRIQCNQKLSQSSCPPALTISTSAVPNPTSVITGFCTVGIDDNPNTVEVFQERVCCPECLRKSKLNKKSKIIIICGTIGGVGFSLLVGVCISIIICRIYADEYHGRMSTPSPTIGVNYNHRVSMEPVLRDGDGPPDYFSRVTL